MTCMQFVCIQDQPRLAIIGHFVSILLVESGICLMILLLDRQKKTNLSHRMPICCSIGNVLESDHVTMYVLYTYMLYM